MTRKNPYKEFVVRYLARGAVGVSVGLATVASTAAAPLPEPSRAEQAAAKSFSDRLSTVRQAVSESANPFHLAAVVPFNNVVRPFSNQFRKTFPRP